MAIVLLVSLRSRMVSPTKVRESPKKCRSTIPYRAEQTCVPVHPDSGKTGFVVHECEGRGSREWTGVIR